MFRKNSVYIIALALAALFVMQGMWLYYAMAQERKYLDESTRQAALESLAALEQKEDARLIVKSLDTLLSLPLSHNDNPDIKNTEVKVIVTNGRKNVSVRHSSGNSVSTAYAYSNDSSGHAQVKMINASSEIIFSGDSGRIKTKMVDYDKLLKKIVIQSDHKNMKIDARVNFTELENSLRKNLTARGIDIKTELAVTGKNDSVIFKSPDYKSGGNIALPMFTRDIISQDYQLHVFYPSTAGFLLKKAMSVILLSLMVTVLLVLVILGLYKKILTGEKLNRYKNDFINNLTHELKTPLATISLANSNISVTLKNENEEVQRYTNIIDEESRKLNNHIEKVLELSLLEKEKENFNLTGCDAHELIRKSMEQNESLIKEKNATVETSLNASRYSIKVDPFHFLNVIGNLINNALKYSKEKPEIRISTVNQEKNIVIVVKDNGIGISEENQKLIFDKFFRVTENNLHSTKGFGIGLSYARQSIELFGGTLEVKSELNKGSEFIITLPYA
jgi:two-component system phosphate regulon sensor histidine kinase PhoR